MTPENLPEFVASLAEDVAKGRLSLEETVRRLTAARRSAAERQSALPALLARLAGLSQEHPAGPSARAFGALAFELARDLRTEESAALAMSFGILCYNLNRPQEAIPPLETALVTCIALGRSRDTVSLLGLLGAAHGRFRRYEQAAACFDAGYRLAQAYSEIEGALTVLRLWGEVAQAHGHSHEAVTRYSQALRYSQELGRRDLQTSLLRSLAANRYQLGEIDQAVASLQEAVHLSAESHEPEEIVRSLAALGEIFRSLAQFPDALQYFTEARQIALKDDQADWHAPLAASQAGAYASLGQTEEALRGYQEAVSLYRKAGDRRVVGGVLAALGELYLQAGRFDESIHHFQEALTLASGAGDTALQMRCSLGLGMSYLFLANGDAALQIFRAAAERGLVEGDTWATAFARTYIGDAFMTMGRPEEALRAWETALEVVPDFGEARERIEVARYCRLEFPAKCVQGRPALLKVQLTLPASDGTPAAPREKEVVLMVSLTADAFDVYDHGSYGSWAEMERSFPEPARPVHAEAHERIPVPREGDSHAVAFALVPREGLPFGRYEVLLNFWNGGRRVGSLVVATTVANPVVTGRAVPRGRPPRSKNIRHELPEARGQVTITAHRVMNGHQYLIAATGGLRDGGLMDRAISAEAARDFVRQLAVHLENLAEWEFNPEQYESVELNLRGIGNNIWQRLPQTLRDYMRSKLSDGSLVQIHAAEDLHWVPWELVFDGDRFWGERFVLTRLPRLMTPGESTLPEAQLTHGTHFLANNISAQATLRASARETFIAYPNVTTIEDAYVNRLERLTRQHRGYGLLHFTCHGSSVSGATPYLLLGPNQNTQKLPTTTVEYLDVRGFALVFANACKSAQIAEFLDGFAGFGKAFTHRNQPHEAPAEAFIGTLGSIPAPPAVEFAKTFYKELLQQRRSVGEALLAARQAFRRRGNPFWLLYCLYGNAELRVRFV